MSSRKLPPLKEVGGEATHCTPGVGHRPSPGGRYTAKGKLQRVMVLIGQRVNMTSTWKSKSESKHHSRHQHDVKIVGMLISVRETYLQRTHT